MIHVVAQDILKCQSIKQAEGQPRPTWDVRQWHQPTMSSRGGLHKQDKHTVIFLYKSFSAPNILLLEDILNQKQTFGIN